MDTDHTRLRKIFTQSTVQKSSENEEWKSIPTRRNTYLQILNLKDCVSLISAHAVALFPLYYPDHDKAS